MNVLVILAGIADPRRPLPAQLDPASLAAHRAAHPQLGPFDEAALELALKLRDADPSTRIVAAVRAEPSGDALQRQVAGLRLDDVTGLDLAGHPAWDSGALAAAIAGWIAGRGEVPDLVLMGREFGDEDEGSLPPLLAEACRLPFIGQTLRVERVDSRWLVSSQDAGGLVRTTLEKPLLAAVTNHPDNRLRHPLLKNVMAARRMSFALATPAADQTGAAVRLLGTFASEAPVRPGRCRMLEGAPAQQARALAELLLESARR